MKECECEWVGDDGLMLVNIVIHDEGRDMPVSA